MSRETKPYVMYNFGILYNRFETLNKAKEFAILRKLVGYIVYKNGMLIYKNKALGDIIDD